MSTQKPCRRLIRELPVSVQPASRLAHVGSDHLTITELIALVLNTADGLHLAEEIVSRFSIKGLAQTTLTELQELRGIGPSLAGRLQAAIELGGRVTNYREDYPQLKNPSDAVDLLMPKLRHREQEHFIVMLLNVKNGVLDIVWLYKGTLTSSVIRTGEIFREAIRRQAAGIIVVHNHPSGDPTPSRQDIKITHDIHKAGVLLEIELLDHLIIGDGRFVSMKQSGLGFLSETSPSPSPTSP